MATNSELISYLKKVSLFASYPEPQLGILAKKMTLISLPKGASLFHENDIADSLLIVVSGSLRVLRPSQLSRKEDRREETIGYLSRGDVIGEMALITTEQRKNTIVADSPSELFVLMKKDFERAIEKNPSIAVHLSRVLSNQLASVQKNNGAQARGKIFSYIPVLSKEDQIIFGLNLGVALTEQTRRKVLLVTVDDGYHDLTRGLRMEPATVTETDLRRGVLRDPRLLREKVIAHASGLEILVLDTWLFSGPLQSQLFQFSEMIKDTFDYALFVLPPVLLDSLKLVMESCDRIFLVAGPHSTPNDLEISQKLQEMIPPNKKVEKIWLSIGAEFDAGDYNPNYRIAWDDKWAREFTNTNSPFIPHDAIQAHRTLDRYARALGGLSIGFAMGSGAAFGYSLIGMLKVMERESIQPDILSGTSMGALIGALYAAGYPPNELERIALSIDRKRLWQMADPTIPRSGLIRGNGVLEFLKSYLGDKTFKDLNVPFSCVATDIQTGKEIVMDEGNVAEAVRASLSLPFFFQPYYLNGRYLVDGGLVNPVPSSIVLAQGANIIISANLTSKAGERRVPRLLGWRKRLPHLLKGPSITEIMMKTIYIMQYEIAAARSELAHVVLEMKSHNYLWWDLDKAKDIIRVGEMIAEENMPKIKSLLPFHADSCRVKLVPRNPKTY